MTVLTDGACDPGVTNIGAVLLERGSHPKFFGLRVPEVIANSWTAGEAYRVVCQAEIISVLIAGLIWAESSRGLHAVLFVDNNAARQSLIKGYSPRLSSCRILGEAALEDTRLGSFS